MDASALLFMIDYIRHLYCSSHSSYFSISCSQGGNSTTPQNFLFSTGSNFAFQNNKARIFIEVSSLKLQPDCGILQDPQVELIFVDYHGFLGLPPDQLETPLSLPKNAPDNTLTFNFRQGLLMLQSVFPLWCLRPSFYFPVKKADQGFKIIDRRCIPSKILLQQTFVEVRWGVSYLITSRIIICYYVIDFFLFLMNPENRWLNKMAVAYKVVIFSFKTDCNRSISRAFFPHL